jgi:hypothetical protein
LSTSFLSLHWCLVTVLGTMLNFLCVQKSHKYVAFHLKIAASHMNKMRILSPFIVTVLSPCINTLLPFLPSDL